MIKSVLITGAGTGLGLEMALFLARHGYTVYASVLDAAQQAHVEDAAARHGVTLRIVQLDVTDERSVAAAVATILRECGGIYALINNAGLSLRGFFEDCDDDEIRRVFEVNLFGVMAATRAVLPHMRSARRGRLVFISSIGGRIASMARTAYCASKFGVEGFAESLMQEVTPLGIRVSIVEPAIIKTERWTVHRGLARRARRFEGLYGEWFRREEALADRLLQTSPTTPADVARTVHEALEAEQPRLRYVVGRRPNAVLTLRRYLPGETFERLYFGEAMRRVTGARRPGLPAFVKGVAASPLPATTTIRKGVSNVLSAFRIVKVLGLRPTLMSLSGGRFSQHNLRGFFTSSAIATLLNVGLIDELMERGSVDLQEFAARNNLDQAVLKTLIDYLYAQKLLRRSGDTYALTARGRVALKAGRGSFDVLYAYEDVLHNLEPLLRKQKTYGVDVNRRSHWVGKGSGEVGELLAFPMMSDTLRRGGWNRVLDLGCGDATFLIDLCERNPAVTGFGIDLSPISVADGEQRIAAQGLQDRLKLVVGDIADAGEMADQFPGIQAATCVYVLHELLSFDRDHTVAMLRKFREGFPGLPLVICEVIGHTADELRDKPGGVMEIQFFHQLSQQYLFSRDEWRSVFEDAGFTNIDIDYLDFVRTAIMTVS